MEHERDRAGRRRAALGTAGVVVAALVLVGCGSTGIGDIFGGGGGGGDGDQAQVSQIEGTVTSVNTREDYLELRDTRTNLNLRNAGDHERVYYDADTAVRFEGNTYSPEDLEVGDQIRVEVDQVDGRWEADAIAVLYDSTSGDRASGAYEVYDLAGVVEWIDQRQRLIGLEDVVEDARLGFSPGGTTTRTTVAYDSGTVVLFEGRQYRPESLEVGDRVGVDWSDNQKRVAEQIAVLRDVRAGR